MALSRRQHPVQTATAFEPMTRKDLQEELSNFTQVSLISAIREAMKEEHDAIASKVYELSKVDIDTNSHACDNQQQQPKPALLNSNNDASPRSALHRSVAQKQHMQDTWSAMDNRNDELAPEFGSPKPKSPKSTTFARDLDVASASQVSDTSGMSRRRDWQPMGRRAFASVYKPSFATVRPRRERNRSIWEPSLKYEKHHQDDVIDTYVTDKVSEVSEPPESDHGITQRSSSREVHVTSGHAYSSLPLIASITSSKPRIAVWQAKIRYFVESSFFEQCSGLIVVLNSIFLGYDTNYKVVHPHETSEIAKVSEIFFCFLFSAELLLRVIAFGRGFFTDDGWKVNMFDAFLVTSQVGEQVLLGISASRSHVVNLGILRLMRLLRIIRFARLFRVIHLFDDLRVIVSSIYSSISSLGWSLVLLLILIYVFSLLFLQCIVSAGHTEHEEQLDIYFSSLYRTFLTMFECVVGGLNWDAVVRPLQADVSWVMTPLFCLYISACLFAMMNILTGIFVDKAMTSVREDKDFVLAKRVRDVFYSKPMPKDMTADDIEADGLELNEAGAEVTWEIFEQKLESRAMQDYFAQINVELENAREIFELMDMDGSGTLTAEEIVRSCLRFRGPARSLDLMVLSKDVNDVYVKLCGLELELLRLPRGEGR